MAAMDIHPALWAAMAAMEQDFNMAPHHGMLRRKQAWMLSLFKELQLCLIAVAASDLRRQPDGNCNGGVLYSR